MKKIRMHIITVRKRIFYCMQTKFVHTYCYILYIYFNI